MTSCARMRIIYTSRVMRSDESDRRSTSKEKLSHDETDPVSRTRDLGDGYTGEAECYKVSFLQNRPAETSSRKLLSDAVSSLWLSHCA